MNLIKVWKDRKAIFEGIRNNIFRKEDIELIAAERKTICDACPELDPTGDSGKCYVPGEPCCKACGCKLAWKLRALSKGCPLSHWEPVLSEIEEEALKTHLEENK